MLFISSFKFWQQILQLKTWISMKFENIIPFLSSFLFKCKGDDEKGHKLTFELEICSIPGLDNMIGK